jgi:hypothetical protein
MVLEITRYENGGMALLCVGCREILWQGNESWFKWCEMTWLVLVNFLWSHQCKAER